MAVSGNYAYVAASETGLEVIDVSDPTRPRQVSRYATSASARGVTVSGNRAYVAVSGNHVFVADGSAGLVVLGPPSPIIVSISRAPLPAGQGEQTTLSYPVSPAKNYTVEWRADLGPGGEWQPLSGAPHNSGTVIVKGSVKGSVLIID